MIYLQGEKGLKYEIKFALEYWNNLQYNANNFGIICSEY